jgi:hypothetical protein
VHRALFACDVSLHTLTRVTGFDDGELVLASHFTQATQRLACRSLVIVGARFANDEL